MDLKGLMLNEKKKKNPVPKASILCECIYITFLKGPNSGNREQIGGVQV